MKRFLASLVFAVLLSFSFVLPQSVEAQDPHRTEHLKYWSEIDFSGNQHIQVETKNNHCLIAEVTNIPGRSRYLIYFNAEFETGRSVVTDHMQQAVNACEQMVRGVTGRSHAVTFFGTDNSVPNRQSANLPLSETASTAQEQSNDYRLAQLRANAGRNLVISELSDIALQNAGNYVPGKFETETVSAPDSLQRLDSLSDQSSLEFRKAFFVMAEVYESGAPDASAFGNRVTAMRDDVNDRFQNVHARIDSLGREHEQTRETARAAQAAADSAYALASIASNKAEQSDGAPEVGVIVGAGMERFARINTWMAEVGVRLGDAEATGWYGRKMGVGTAELKRGVTTIHRETYGVSLSWYPLDLFDRVEIGPSAAFEHGEDYLNGREEYVRGYESSQVGLALNTRIIGPLSLHGGIRYQIGEKFEPTDLNLDPVESNFRAQVTLRIKL